MAVAIHDDVSLQLRIARPVASTWRDRNQVAVVVVEVRDRRSCNGSLPPLIEARVLQSVEKELKDCIRGSDSVIRTADHQFSILLHRVTGAEDVSRAFGRIVQSLERN
ncbi:MAG: diguanylate cyclase [Steroidobacteraceae bacterium]